MHFTFLFLVCALPDFLKSTLMDFPQILKENYFVLTPILLPFSSFLEWLRSKQNFPCL